MTAEAIPLIVCRLIPASAERIFDAFRTADHLCRWFRPGPEVSVEALHYDFVPDGAYRLRYAMPDGRRPTVGGIFDQIEQPSRVSFSWEWEAPDPLQNVPMHVCFDFHAKGAATEVRVTHRGIPTDVVCTMHADGWEATLALLARRLQEEGTG